MSVDHTLSRIDKRPVVSAGSVKIHFLKFAVFFGEHTVVKRGRLTVAVQRMTQRTCFFVEIDCDVCVGIRHDKTPCWLSC